MTSGLAALGKIRRNWLKHKLYVAKCVKENRILSKMLFKCCVCGISVDEKSGFLFEKRKGVHFICRREFDIQVEKELKKKLVK